LAGKVSLVTGSTSGIGLGIARALAEAGSAVVLNGFGVASEIARTKDQFAADFGVKVGYSAADMTSPAAIAEMIDATSEDLKKRIGWVAYVFAGVRHLRRRPIRVRIRLDGGKPIRRRARTVLVGNVGRLQGGIPLLPDARPDDGWLDVAVLTPHTLGHWFAMAWGILRRRRDVQRMETFRARHVEVFSNRPQPRELDGDLIEPARTMDVTIRPGALWLCVPDGVSPR